MCEQQYRFMTMVNFPSCQRRLVIFDKDDLVGPGDIAMIYDDKFIPVDGLVEVDTGDFASGRRAADGDQLWRFSSRRIYQGSDVQLDLAS